MMVDMSSTSEQQNLIAGLTFSLSPLLLLVTGILLLCQSLVQVYTAIQSRDRRKKYVNSLQESAKQLKSTLQSHSRIPVRQRLSGLRFEIGGEEVIRSENAQPPTLLSHQGNIENNDPLPEGEMHNDGLLFDAGVKLETMRTSDGLRKVICTNCVNDTPAADFVTESYTAPRHLEGMIFYRHLNPNNNNRLNLVLANNPRFAKIGNFYSYYRTNAIVKLTSKTPFGYAQKVKVALAAPLETNTTPYEKFGFTWDLSKVSTVYFKVPYLNAKYMITPSTVFASVLISPLETTPPSIDSVPLPHLITSQVQLIDTKFYVLKHATLDVVSPVKLPVAIECYNPDVPDAHFWLSGVSSGESQHIRASADDVKAGIVYGPTAGNPIANNVLNNSSGLIYVSYFDQVDGVTGTITVAAGHSQSLISTATITKCAIISTITSTESNLELQIGGKKAHYATSFVRESCNIQRDLGMKVMKELGINSIYTFDSIGFFKQGESKLTDSGIRYLHFDGKYAVLSQSAQNVLPVSYDKSSSNHFNQLAGYQYTIDCIGCVLLAPELQLQGAADDYVEFLEQRFLANYFRECGQKPCIEHYNTGSLHIDGPPPRKIRCRTCIADLCDKELMDSRFYHQCLDEYLRLRDRVLLPLAMSSLRLEIGDDSSDTAAAQPELNPGPRPVEPVNASSTVMEKVIGVNEVSVDASQGIYVPLQTTTLTENWTGLNLAITPAKWFRNGTSLSQAQIEAIRFFFCGPSKRSNRNEFCNYKITSTANAFQNARLIVAQIPETVDASTLDVFELTQYPHKEHQLHGRETIIPCQWMRALPVMAPRNGDTNGTLAIRLIENSLSSDSTAPSITVWVQASNIEYSIPAQPLVFTP
uniref:Nonstructural protein WIV domain-containing protein n=1 Tax=Riboviria sp. TaxID=2585031 RepID=A0A6M3YNP8_9VIRU|nr:MAG: hypothetical protein [Riboviria sp.]